MEAPFSLPFVVALTLHAAGVAAALLSRLSFGQLTDFTIRSTLLALAVVISGLGLQSVQQGLGGWPLSGMTLGAMVILAVLHVRADDQDPVLARVVAAHR